MRNFYLLFAGVLFVGLAACGGNADRAMQQKHGQVEIPEYRGHNNNPLLLTGDSGDLFFTGSLLIWNEHVSVPQIKRIADATRQTRVLKSEISTLFNETLVSSRERVASADHEFAAFEKQRNAMVDRGYRTSPLVRSDLLPLVSEWFPKRVAELRASGVVKEADRPHIEQMFGAYCEYKLWELALSPLSTLKYQYRPTPFAMCESYYQSKQYFTDEILCADSGADGKDYFSCLWNDGVLRSDLFVAKLDATPCRPTPNSSDYPSRGAAIRAWVVSGLLNSVLSDKELLSNKTYADQFVEDSMSGFPYPTALFSKSVNGVQVYSDLRRCRIAFNRKDLLDGSVPEAERWKHANFDALRFIMEGGGEFKLLPSSGDPERDASSYKQLAWYILAFSSRITPSGEGLASYSDKVFNRAVGHTFAPRQEYIDVIKTDEAFKALHDFEDELLPSDLRKKIESAEERQVSARKDLAAQELNYNKLQDDLRLNQTESIRAVTAPGATLLFNEFVLNIANSERFGRVELKFGDGKPFVACLSYHAENHCPTDLPDTNASATFDAESGRLVVSAQLLDPSVYGFAKRAISDEGSYFNYLEDSVLIGKVLEMEFDLNQMSSWLEFFTGSTYIKDDAGIKIFEGSHTGDNFSQRLEN